MKIVFFILIGLYSFVFADIPLDRRPDWSTAGLIEEPPKVADWMLDIRQYEGSTADQIYKAIEVAGTLDGWVIIYIPEGEYDVDRTIKIKKDDLGSAKGIIFSGDGPNKTILKFTNSGDEHCFYLKGDGFTNKKSFYSTDSVGLAISNTFLNGEELKVKDSYFEKIKIRSEIILPLSLYPNIKIGEWLFFYEPSAITDYDGTEEQDFIGQFLQVKEINNNVIRFKQTANKTYRNVMQEFYPGFYEILGFNNEPPYTDNSLAYKLMYNDLTFQKFTPIQNIGIEDLKIERVTDDISAQGKNIMMEQAVNCWVDRIESYNATHGHVQISKSANCTVKNSYFHEATGYNDDNGGGKGYGIIVDDGSTNCLIENNRLKKYRHAILTARGANGNVFTYNYMSDPGGDWWKDVFLSFDIEPGCIRLHGEYSFGNLFEANSAEFIFADPTHGMNGPYNTFFNNITRIEGNNLLLFNIEKANTSKNIFQTGTLTPNGSIRTEVNVVEQTKYDNAKNGVSKSYSSTCNSYYYTTKPSFIKEDYDYPPTDTDKRIYASKIGTEDYYNSIEYSMLKFLNAPLRKKTSDRIIAGKTIFLQKGFIANQGEKFNAKIDKSLAQ